MNPQPRPSNRKSNGIQERIRALQSSGCYLENETNNMQSSCSNPSTSRTIASLNDSVASLDLTTDTRHNISSKPFAFLELPAELKQRVASFLSIGEVLRLTETAKSIMADLDMTVECSPLTDRASQNKMFNTLNRHRCFATVVPKPESLLHSMTFSCDVIRVESDGEICIKRYSIPEKRSPEDLKMIPAFRGKLVAFASVFRNEQKVVTSFHPSPNKCYQFLVKSTGYGCREGLRLENMKLYRVGFGTQRLDYTAYQYDVCVERGGKRGRRHGVK